MVDSGQNSTARAMDGRPGGPQVLVLDDSQDAADLLAMYLRRRGFNALAGWGSGHAILKLVLEKTPDVAVIDLDLPELDGLEVARQLRGRIGRATVLVAPTGHSQDTDRMRSKEAGFDHFPVKPDLHSLLKILSDVALSGAHEHQAA